MSISGIFRCWTFCSVLLVVGGAGWAQTAPGRTDDNTITVSGTGEVRLKPDQVSLAIGVWDRGSDPDILRERVAGKVTRVLQTLEKAGVKGPNVQTSQYSVQRYWDEEAGPKRRGKPVGQFMWRVSNTISAVTEQVDRAGRILDAVWKSGANDVNGPYYGLKDPSAARRTALKEAYADARRDGEVIAEAAGGRLMDLVRAGETTGGYGSDDYYASNMSAMVGFAPGMPGGPVFEARAKSATPVRSGEIVVTASVTAVFRFGM